MGAHNHNLTERFAFAGKAKTFSLIAIVLGVIAIAYGFLSGHAERTFANLLLMGYYFACVCMAGVFFMAVQYVAQAGWSVSVIRIPQAFARVLPIAAVILIVIVAAGLFSHNLYNHWNEPGLLDKNAENYDPLIVGKSAFLNVPFFLGRMVVFLGIYSIFAMLLVKYSRLEDEVGGLSQYHKSFKVSCIFLVIFGFTTPVFAFDTIMSLEAHWFSTMFGWYNFAAMWVAGLATIALTTILLKKAGYMSWVNENHLHDLGKFIFAFSIFWTYVWFAQFLLIYYANMPEETVYFYKRFDSYLPWFWINIVVNFVAPLLILMTRDAKRRENTLMFVCIVILLGHWVDYYQMIMPGAIHDPAHSGFGIIEIGTAAGFAGLFTFFMLNALSKTTLVPKNHPFLEESLHHQI